MTLDEVMAELESYGKESTKKTLMKHGGKEPIFGVPVADLKKILKKTKKNHELSLALYDTGNSDAMYLAGLMADETQMTPNILQDWVEKAYWHYLSEYTVPWIASETEHGFDLGLKWIESDKENIAAAGWATLANYASIRPDDELDIATYGVLMERAAKEVHTAQNRVRYVMNGFVIALGIFTNEFTEKAKELGAQIGPVNVDMNGTACKVPLALPYIEKNEKMGRVGKKRKTSRC